MPPITLLTDFGTSDTYVGQMKGVIAGIAPAVTVIDLTHDLPPQDVLTAAITLDAAIDAFPTGTIHVAVVDPGVGSARHPIAVRTARYTFVGPDNGLFTAAMQRHPAQRIVRLTNPRYHHRPAATGEVSATFHGRDIFSPAAAHLAAGIPLEHLGDTTDQLHTLDLPQPRPTDADLELHVLLIDHFGNLITDLTRDHAAPHITDPARATLTVGRTTITGIRRTFADVAEGEPVAYFGSSNRLEVAIRNGHAARTLNVTRGDTIHLAMSTSD